MRNLLSELNEEQRKAAAQVNGPVMIIAGAGSGKTRTLTYRIAHLIEQGIDPFHVLALTFTNKAANEMKQRIIQLTGNQAKSIWMGTFHSVFAKILRFEAEKLGYISSFTIYDTDDSKNAIKQIIKGMNLDPKVYNPSYVLSRISMAKSTLLSAEEYCENLQIQQDDKYAKKPFIGKIYLAYNQRLRNAMAMDFDDLLFNTNILLRDFPDVLLKYQNKFRYILVDEYQDTNYAQYLIVKKLAARYENICVVGDDAQSIYAFRGANIQNILNFKKDYPSVKMFKLEQNYRSTQYIVDAANSVISNNKEQIFKKVWTENDKGHPISLMRASNEHEEGLLVAHSIKDNISRFELNYKDFAILYRTNMQSRSIEDGLRKLNIPYKIYGGLSFYRRKEIRDVLAYFRLVVNNYDEEALLRVVNYPARGIGETTLDKIRLTASHNQCSMFEIMENADRISLDINGPTTGRILDFVNMIKAETSQLQTLDAYDLACQILNRSGVIRFLKENNDPENANRVENIEELMNAIQEFCAKEDVIYDELTGEMMEKKTLDVFLQQVLLLTGEEEDKTQENNHVSLMTIHSAKGLEFKNVFVVGMEENLFPSTMSLHSKQDLEEERRLFYVAVTRAEKHLTLSYAETRFHYGTPSFQEPSRFIDEIDDRCIASENTKKKKDLPEFKPTFIPLQKTAFPRNTAKPPGKQAFPTPPAKSGNNEGYLPVENIHNGMQVLHDKFGVGKVLSIEDEGDNKKAIVFFEGFGQKTLILRFAKLKAV